MKNITKIIYILSFLLAATYQVNSAEKVELLKTDWSFKGYLANLTEVHYKEAIRFIRRFAHHVIQ